MKTVTFQTEIYSQLELPAASSTSALAKNVLILSDAYLKRARALDEIWRNENLAQAYLAYYLPLNWLRASSVIAEGQHLGFFHELIHAIDVGSGPGTFHFAARERDLDMTSWTFVESESAARDWHERLLRSWPQGIGPSSLKWERSISRPPTNPKNTLGVFSYSLNELGKLPSWAFDLEALCVIEPSDMERGRRLQELRTQLINRGFSIWAPCTHQAACPLLTHSKTDWCHHRIHVLLPPSVAKLEAHLPMKNNTLTYSYLLARRSPARTKPAEARVIGDTLYERGKVRQAICRGPNREFLSWLTRFGEPEPIPRGTCLEIPKDAEIKGNEIRLPRD